MKLLFIANIIATIFMTGVIWIVQVVHYPLFAKVGDELFRSYHADHNVLISYIVLPAMLIEAGTAAYFVLERPSIVTPLEAWIGLILVVIAWGGTFFFSVPQHGVLASGFDAQAHRALVNTNWIRTVAWSLRALLAALHIYKLLDHANY